MVPFLFFTALFKARHKVTEIINNAIVHYRDDVDLQNLIDYGQTKVGVFSEFHFFLFFACLSVFENGIFIIV